MKAVVVTQPGGPEVLEIREVRDPEYGPDEILIRVRATAVNRADVLQRRGRYKAPHGTPADIPGLEFAGEVEASGGRVLRFRPGDRVMGLVGGGAYAEKVAVHERVLVAIPESLSFEQAGAVPEAFLTAYDALHARGALASGETVLLHAAASGVGTAALQIARRAGARVIALSRTEEKRRKLEELGADRVLDPALPDLPRILREAAGGSFDLVLDFLGAGAWALNLEVLGERGRLVIVGTMAGSVVEADLSVLLRKRLTVTGTMLRSRPIEEKIALARSFERRMVPMLAIGKLVPVVDRVLPLEEAGAAHAAMERNENFGKIVLGVS